MIRASIALVLVAASACATAVVDPNDPTVPLTDGGVDASHKDSSVPFNDPDSSNPPPDPDAGGNPQPDSGAPDASPPPPDAGPSNCPSPMSGVLATFDFAGQPGNQVSTPPKMSVTGLTTSAMTRSTVTANAGLNSMNSATWTLSASPNLNTWVGFTLTPDPKCTLDITAIDITTATSALGPAAASIGTSDDAFKTLTKFAPASAAKVTLSVAGATKAVDVHVFGYGAIDVGGTMRLNSTLTISGALK